ncbi:MAG: FG-GAP repeat protein [Planctomycetes bacterium]|nr:FG-GAP repeat protein [Planctomycetota bacterium]
MTTAYRISAFLTGLVVLNSASLGQFVEPIETVHVWTGEVPFARFGFINRVMGDVDGDGVLDAGIGVPENSEGGVGSGKVFIYSGRTGILIREHTGNINDFLGWEMSGVGDVNRDGFDDYVIGAPQTFNLGAFFGPGHAYLHSGATGELLHTWTGQVFADGFGLLCAGAGNVIENLSGDINGDGVPDILIAAPLNDTAAANAGRVYVYSGANYDELIYVINGEAFNDRFGFSVGGLGDLNGDGLGEFIVGASNGGPLDHGRAYVYDGATGHPMSFSPLDADSTGLNFGHLFSSGPGDVNGDGTFDIFVADISNTAFGVATGRSYVYSGLDGSLIHVWTGEAALEGMGVRRGAGDVNFDGYADIVVSSFRSGLIAEAAGKTFVFSGRDGSILRTITGTIESDRQGWSTVGIGDVNNDGAIDFMISSVGNDDGGTDVGRVYVIAGEFFPCSQDLDGDGSVGTADLLELFAQWATDGPADFDGSGAVGTSDLLILFANWGSMSVITTTE